MARLARLSFAGRLHLVVLTSLPAQALFVDDEDRKSFLQAMLECSRACDVAVHAYALLDHEILLLLTPATAPALPAFMQRIGRRYVADFNRRHGRTGPLWSRRYGAAAIEASLYGWQTIRLIERAPVRLGRASRPQDWPWSSAGHYVGATRNPLLREHELHWRLGNTPFEREARHADAIGDGGDDEAVPLLLAAASRGRPIGSRAFLDELAEAAGRPVDGRPRGRPRRVDAPQ